MDEKNHLSLLVEGVLNNQRASFDELVDLLKDKGIRVAYGIVGNLEDAKDVLQESFIKMYVNIGKFNARSSISTWFYRIVVNSSYDFLKKKKAKKRIKPISMTNDGDLQMDIADQSLMPDKRLTQDCAYLDIYIDRLSLKQKQVVMLRYKSGFSVDEVANMLGCKASTIKVHLFRAINNLRKALEANKDKQGEKDV